MDKYELCSIPSTQTMDPIHSELRVPPCRTPSDLHRQQGHSIYGCAISSSLTTLPSPRHDAQLKKTTRHHIHPTGSDTSRPDTLSASLPVQQCFQGCLSNQFAMAWNGTNSIFAFTAGSRPCCSFSGAAVVPCSVRFLLILYTLAHMSARQQLSSLRLPPEVFSRVLWYSP